MERLSVATTFAIGLLMKHDGTNPADMNPRVIYVLSLTKNMTNAKQEKIYWELWFIYGEKNPQRQCDSSNIELSQGTKPSEQTPGNSTASPVVENTEIKTLNDTCDNPVSTSDTLKQYGDVANGVAYKTVSPVVENSENKILNNTCDKPAIINQDGNIVNEARAQLNSKTTSG